MIILTVPYLLKEICLIKGGNLVFVMRGGLGKHSCNIRTKLNYNYVKN